MTSKILAASFLVPLLAGCTTAPADNFPDPKLQIGALETRIAILVEEQREKFAPTAKIMAIDPELTKIARARAQDMADKHYLAHAAPNGDTAATLLMAENAKFQGLLGENLAAQHYVKESGVDADAFAERFLATWADSAPHRENFSFPDYDRTGVGVAVNGDTVYVAQLFADDRGLGPRDEKAAAAGDNESKTRLGVLQTQLSETDRTAAQKSAATFHATALNRSANVPPETADLPAN